MITKKQILSQLRTVMDPELGISLVDLGLIYGVKCLKNGFVKVTMTLTTMGCPLFDVMADDIKTKVKTLKGVKDVKVELVFEPVWSTDKMSKNAKEQLGIE
ncbi:MAG: hypothetical protein UR52_C0008G0021 [Candidatus Gottesmanbacteria bacterium GW2011_GWA1_34_13]|uniref:MIP18 family-like domain-containing protein n=1 Tax=Candidatus Gottesmanbacteria bacterium GW2011_GWA1_34_13 TaxID=1618434 RepID=A0A0G0B6H4_9BACT|nr:MAG: hypothetical protein UR52_C0008G0021 [Candidatus Gottesmanbacteria bacterium GW2011_GWA1_34_13]